MTVIELLEDLTHDLNAILEDVSDKGSIIGKEDLERVIHLSNEINRVSNEALEYLMNN